MEAGMPETAESPPELSCRESQLILKILPLRKQAKTMKKGEVEAVKHHLYCKPCRDLGLAGILDEKLSCRDALLVWAEQASAMHLDFLPNFKVGHKTLIEIYAVEHVWGKYQWKNERGGSGADTSTACSKRPCQRLYSYWRNVPMSTGAGDGADGVIHLMPKLIAVFREEGWPLEPLLKIQNERTRTVLRNLVKGKVSVSPGHYHSPEELAQEILANVEALQGLAVNPSVNGKK